MKGIYQTSSDRYFKNICEVDLMGGGCCGGKK